MHPPLPSPGITYCTGNEFDYNLPLLPYEGLSLAILYNKVYLSERYDTDFEEFIEASQLLEFSVRESGSCSSQVILSLSLFLYLIVMTLI